MSEVTKFGSAAEKLARNPLGVIALFLVLVYGLAAMVVTLGDSLTAAQKTPLIYFLVLFPVLILGVFAWLVSRHSGKLFAPSDFRDEDNYLKALTATASLAVAAAQNTSDSSKVDVGAVVASVRESVGSRRTASASGRERRLLWADDRPGNNSNERRAFEAAGLEVTLAYSTDEALELVGRHGFAVVISDMRRPQGADEGFVLLDALRRRNDTTPYFLYTGHPAKRYAAELTRRAGQGSFDAPQELFRAVMAAALRDHPTVALS